MIKKIRTNEGIQYKKLSQEEMKARGILGRLIGPCADFNNATRNGRKYSEQLWENVFNDPIMQEKIKNGVCFGELGHPEDRTEIDMEKIAVCLREQPVKNEQGQLCAVFDILDTPNGRILKTLCDYGSTVGVSSRGQGDLISDADGNEVVDPDTYECECWDIVLVPAVKTARLQYVKEDLDKNTLKMKKALCESLNKATDEEKKVMESTLKELNIRLDEDVDTEQKDYEKDINKFLDEIKTKMSPEEAKKYYYDEFQFDKTAPADDIEKQIADALKAKAGINEGILDAVDTVVNGIGNGVEKLLASDEAEKKDQEEDKEESETDIADLDNLLDFDDAEQSEETEEQPLDDIEISSEEEIDLSNEDDEISTEETPVEEPTEEEDERSDEEIFFDYLENNFSEKQVKDVLKALDIELPEDEETEEESDDESEEEESEDKEDENVEDSEADVSAVEDEESDESEEDKEEKFEEDINITNNDSPGRVEAPRTKTTTTDEKAVEEGLGLLGVGDINVNVDASGQNNAVGLGGSKPSNEGLIPGLDDLTKLVPNIPGLSEECNDESCADKKDQPKDKQADKKEEKAVDNGDESLVESLMQTIRSKSNLENEVKSLQEKLAVSDTKVNKLNEEISNYKKTIARLATISKSTKDLQKNVSSLEESLKEKDDLINEQKTRINRLVKSRKESVSESLSLNESIESKVNEVKSLNESLKKAEAQVEELNKQLTEAKSNSDKQVTNLQESVKKAESLKESYKKLANKAVNKYIDIKANMLGLTNQDIKRKLGESYTLEDVDQVCEELKSYQLNVSKLPFSVDRNVRVKVNENASRLTKSNKQSFFDDDDVDDGLIRMAKLDD